MLISNGGAELLMDSSAKFPPGRGGADTKATSSLSRQAFPLILLTGATGYIGGLLRALQEREHPRPLHGKTSGALKLRYIGRGMHLEFCHPTYHTITTSRVVDIRTAALR